MVGRGVLLEAELVEHTAAMQKPRRDYRVALARAIVMEPKVLLFDEPLSNLDAKLREQMRVEIRDLQQRLGITSLYVTHDQVEAMSISDRIVVMNGGLVEQVGTPQEVYVRPATRFVADFIGKANFATAQVVGEREVDLAGHCLRLAIPTPAPIGSSVTLVVRPETVRLSPEAGPLQGIVRRVMFLGNIVEYAIDVEKVGTWLIDQPNPAESVLFEVGHDVFLEPSGHAVQAIQD
jgi:iron(III) transport system ATP-binding protein